MVKKRQSLGNHDKLVTFVVRLPGALKKRLEDYSDRSGQSQASIITSLVADHIPNDGDDAITLPEPPVRDDLDLSDNRVDLKKWLADHGKG